MDRRTPGSGRGDSRGRRRTQGALGLPGRGKRGGPRIIYFNYAADGVLVLVMIYSKSEREQVSPGDIEKAD